MRSDQRLRLLIRERLQRLRRSGAVEDIVFVIAATQAVTVISDTEPMPDMAMLARLLFELGVREGELKRLRSELLAGARARGEGARVH